MRRALVGALAAVSLLASCTPSSPVAAPSGDPNFATVAQAVLPLSPDPAGSPQFARFYHQIPSWTPCEPALDCARVTVPVDWSAPGGATIQLALMRLPATDPGHRIGSLLVNPGGPGGSGLDLVRAAKEAFSDGLRARYDIVGFDPRGVGQSAPVHCLSDDRLNAFLTTDTTPDDQGEIDALVKGAREFAAGCRARSGALLPNMGTRYVARDLDVLRAVLGQDKLNWFGFSYGTYVGSFYAGMFPNRIGRMVLDGPLDPALSPASLGAMQAAGFQDEFDRFADHCVATNRCPIGSSRQTITDTLTAFLNRLDTNPQHTPSGRLLSETDAITGLADAMYTPLAWDVAVLALAEAYLGHGDRLLALADELFSRTKTGQFKDNSNEANVTVNCLDHPGDDTVADAKAQAPAMRAASLIFGVSFAWSNLACADMPHLSQPPVAGPVRALGAAPILIVATTHDPATPYPWALALSHQLASGVLLTREGDGHTGYNRGNKCIDSAVEAYLLERTVPKRNTRC